MCILYINNYEYIYIYIWSKTAIWSICSKRISHGVVVFSIFPRFLDDLDAMIWRGKLPVISGDDPCFGVHLSASAEDVCPKGGVPNAASLKGPHIGTHEMHFHAFSVILSYVSYVLFLCSKSAAFLRTYWWRQKNPLSVTVLEAPIPGYLRDDPRMIPRMTLDDRDSYRVFAMEPSFLGPMASHGYGDDLGWFI
jgi:hypothetical protein